MQEERFKERSLKWVFGHFNKYPFIRYCFYFTIFFNNHKKLDVNKDYIAV